MKVNESAPAVAWAEVEVAASPEVVWEVLTSIDDWPSWNPDVSSAHLEGGLSEGAQFRWKAGPETITSTLQRIDRPRLIAWTGRTCGIKAIHVPGSSRGARGPWSRRRNRGKGFPSASSGDG